MRCRVRKEWWSGWRHGRGRHEPARLISRVRAMGWRHGPPREMRDSGSGQSKNYVLSALLSVNASHIWNIEDIFWVCVKVPLFPNLKMFTLFYLQYPTQDVSILGWGNMARITKSSFQNLTWIIMLLLGQYFDGCKTRSTRTIEDDDTAKDYFLNFFL